ncbi:MAG: tetratricopeptide repeat protein [Candidatus Cloacimonetes bacterium]|jgi:tetratricopeptide (TPR) repeat protein|nr:tetratricopeptide repeat protein [Candidatus Cloacimonadota bacterium]MCK9335095.1 tetratricopeptide repeat protein [Candidatus Cloacimonadota bacterium]MDD3096967.1 tetratricopeptide repeat protein [Candidatus Cloacimonadota bacterium]MDD3577939.1 tetratricopeptide repeat protein [Candidatus Cloacimonadota bacterium]
MKKIFLCVLALAMVLSLFSQYDEKQILSQQANQMMVQRQYNQAETIFLQILEKYPNDLNTILQLMQIYLNLNNGEKAENLLNQYQRMLPQTTYSEQRIQLLLMQGKMDEARAETDAYLSLHTTDASKYRLIANYYERRNFYDLAIELYERARAKIDRNLFSLEIANAAMQAQNPPKALREYLLYMSSASNVNHYVKNQIKTIVLADSTLISEIATASQNYNTPIMNELYANALVSIRDYPRALEIYKSLPETYLRDFALEQMRLKNYDVALPAYRHLGNANPQPFQRLSYHFEVARMFYEQAEYDSCSLVLQNMLRDPYWKQSPANQRNRLHVQIRKLIAETSLARGEDINTVKSLMEEARSFTAQLIERDELDLDLAKLHVISGEYQIAEAKLNSISQAPLIAKRDYLRFLSRFLQNDTAAADSLMNEYMLKHPGDENANDIIYLNMLSINMQPEQQKSFASAITLLQQMRPEGIDSLQVVFSSNQDEELLLLAVEWAIGFGDFERARNILEHEFQDALAAEYASYLRLALMADAQEELELARNFLKSKPNSIFSPGFRQVIARVANSRISL